MDDPPRVAARLGVHELGTSLLREWCSSLLTGLLSIEDYAREVSATSLCVAEDEVTARVASRSARQQRVLLPEEPPIAWVLVE